MKVLLIVATCFLAANAVSYEDVFMQEWNLFKAEFNKSYATPDEELMRMKIFKDSKYEIASHNMKYKSGEVSYEMGINFFSDMTAEEVDDIYNGFNKENRLKAKNGEVPYLPEPEGELFVAPPNVKAPSEVNWVSKGAVAPVRNQGSCGSCYAFAALGALEGHQYLKTKQMITLSPQNIVDCSRNFGNKGCNGGLATWTYSYIRANNGVNRESKYPYEGREGKCRFDRSDIAATVTGYVTVPAGNEEALKNAVALGPVAVSIDASLSSFQKYKSGVYSDPQCSSSRLGHAVLLVGYGTDQATQKDYWLIKNSWDTTWGDKGYVKIARKGNVCGVATRPVYPKV